MVLFVCGNILIVGLSAAGLDSIEKPTGGHLGRSSRSSVAGHGSKEDPFGGHQVRSARYSFADVASVV